MYGEWWIDTRRHPPRDLRPPRRTVAGNLLDEGLSGWRLETIGPIGPGTIDDPFGSDTNEFFRQPHTIHGCDSANTMYSLLDCWLTNGQFQAPSVRGGLHYWRVGMIVQGTGIMVTPEVEIDRIDLRISPLGVWAFDARQSFIGHDADAGGESYAAQLQDVSARVRDCELQILWNPATGAHSNSGADAFVRIAGPLKLLEINEAWVLPVTRLVALLSAQTAYVTGIQARLRDRFGRKYPTYVEVRIPQPLDEQVLQEPKESASHQQIGMLAIRRALEDNSIDIGQLIVSYFTKQEDDDLRDALRHLIDSQAKTSGFKFDDSLLYGFNSFESYHGALHDSNWEVSNDIAATYDNLVSSAPIEHREVVRNRLIKKPRKSFQMMLDNVMADCGEAAASIAEAFPEVSKSLDKLRNTIAHTNQGSMTLSQRIDLLGTLHWIMRRALLQAFGIPSNACDRLLAHNHGFKDHLWTIRSRYGTQSET